MQDSGDDDHLGVEAWEARAETVDEFLSSFVSEQPAQHAGALGSSGLQLGDTAEEDWYRPARTDADSVASGPSEEQSMARDETGGGAEDKRTALRPALAAEVGQFNIGQAVAAAHQQLAPEPIKHVWETGVWAEIFGDKDMFGGAYGNSFSRPSSSLGPAAGVETKPISEDVQKAVAGARGTFLQALRKKDDVGWKDKREKELLESLGLWLALIQSWSAEEHLVQQVLGAPDPLEVVRDLLGRKAPSTLIKRYRSLVSYCNFLGVGFPGTEGLLYEFLCEQRAKGRPPSARKSVIEALSFVRHVLGVQSVAPLNESRRCHGNAATVAVKDKAQASPLKVDELKRLHAVLESDPMPWNRVFAGAVLMCVYGRSRWEDFVHAETLIWDEDAAGKVAFVECGVGVHKSSRAKQFRGHFLPIVSPAIGVTEQNWGASWREERKRMGLRDPPDGPMMPAPGENLEATARSIESDEAGAWLRLLLFGRVDRLKDRRVSSHSCKCTCISYATKFGASPPEILVLGHHTSDFKMGITYGRDAVSPSLLLLQRVFSSIRAGEFKPDETRSGRFTNKKPKVAVIEIKDEDVDCQPVNVEVPDSEADRQLGGEACRDEQRHSPVTTSSSSSETDSSSNPPARRPPLPARHPRPVLPEGLVFWIHPQVADTARGPGALQPGLSVWQIRRANAPMSRRTSACCRK